MQVTGYKVGGTDKSIAFVAEDRADIAGVIPFHVPLSKIEGCREADAIGKRIATAHGDRVGIPMTLVINDAFYAKVYA